MRNWMAVALLVPFVLSTGCSSGDNLLPGLNQESVSGRAYDGYLIGARVCVDINLNKACDTGEPHDTTDINGNFDIGSLTPAQAGAPLVLEATPSTVDSETGAVDPDLKFLAPPGSTSINPFSTIIQMKIEQAIADGSTKTLAALKTEMANELATELGVTVDLTKYDPIAAKRDTTLGAAERRTASELSLVAKVLTEQINTLLPQAIANSNDGETAAFGAMIEQLDAADVMTAVQNDTSGLATTDLNDATADQVTTETQPTAPTTGEIATQASEDTTYQTTVEDGQNTSATGGTGA